MDYVKPSRLLPRIGHAMLSAVLWCLSRLPFCVLYFISDVLCFLTHRVVRYRVKVVRDNLQQTFPGKSRSELRKIEAEFYRNLTDYFVETVKLNHISDEETRRRLIYEDVDIVDSLFDSGKSIVCYFAHCFNWEWAPSITLWSRYGHDSRVDFSQVYRPLKNKWFDAYFLHLRSRFGSVSYPKHSVLRDLLRVRRDGRLAICGFMSDQKPSHGDPTHPMLFLGRPTAMITGTETLARKLGMAAVYMDMYKASRGHYRIRMRLLAEDASELPPMELTERYAAVLQQTILRNPSIWLWSHKRWRYPVTFPDNTAENAKQQSEN